MMIHALRGPQHFVLKPVALRENNLDLRTDEILCRVLLSTYLTVLLPVSLSDGARFPYGAGRPFTKTVFYSS